MEVAPDVHQVPVSRTSNVFLITEPVLTLVDSGVPQQGGKIAAYIARMGRSLNDVCRLILTHHDTDHIGSAQELRRVSGMDVYLHPLDEPYALGQKRRKPFLLAAFQALMARNMRYGPPRPALPLEDGQLLDDIRVIHTPGHTPGHVCLLRDGVLFAGDAFVTGEKFSYTPRILNTDNAQARASVRRLLEYEFHTAVSGHGAPATDAKAKLERLLRSN